MLCIIFLIGVVHATEAVSPLDKFLSLSDPNCDLQIIHDAVDSDIFQGKEPHTHPTVIFHANSPYDPRTIDVFQARPGSCHVSLFLINCFRFPEQIGLQEEEYDLRRLFELAKNWQLHFNEKKLRRLIPTKIMYTIIVANGEKSYKMYKFPPMMFTIS